MGCRRAGLNRRGSDEAHRESRDRREQRLGAGGAAGTSPARSTALMRESVGAKENRHTPTGGSLKPVATGHTFIKHRPQPSN